MTVRQALDCGEIGLRIKAVQLGGLCRPLDYAELARLPQDSS
jgi:hypothetical protein